MADIGWRRGSSPAARTGARQRAGLTPASASNTLSCQRETLHSQQLRSIKKSIDSDHGIYRETLEHLADLLAREGFAFARFEGALSGPAKDAAIAAFRERVPVLLCTESGGEGRNIQFCNTLINFDVPWNPMAIEQRIGRIDRIGQQRQVFVFNLVTRGTL